MTNLPPVVDPEELTTPEARHDVLFVDARSGEGAAARFRERHLVGAVHVELDQELAAKPEDPARGGRHPLPTPEAFSRVLQWLGVGPRLRVVVYDDKGGANAAARLWWMMRAAGQPRVQVLNGGIDAAIAAGIPTGSDVGARPTARHRDPFGEWQLPIAQADEVEEATRDPQRLVIDVRDPVRYRGESDPFDPSPGHVPGAINVPYSTNLDAAGRFLPPAELAAKYRGVLGGRDASGVIVHCGSGVTACHTLLAMERAGITGAKLYVGSWSEWARSGRPVARGDSPR
jgi:thiosulfate/3-mercaptopyruvate sulfurtransferase